MNKNILAGIVIASVFVIGAGTLAPTASALTANELQVQIKELLAKVADLTNQLNILLGSDATTVTIPGSEIISDAFMPSPHRVCGILNRNVSSGAQGDDVRSLQEFLRDEGYLSANATGYFGPMTAGAVAKWQASQGVSSVGSVGPVTRERIKRWCGGGNSGLLRATPQSGSAPLVVQFSATVTTPSDYSFDFGDGSWGAPSQCAESYPYQCSISHTYTVDGTYTATLYKGSAGGCPNDAPGCLGLPASQKAVGRVQIRVGTPAPCLADAMQCSDGSWVGRTGPNCQFVCPGFNTSTNFRASPTYGIAPLAVSFSYVVGGDVASAASYVIDFGDGASAVPTIGCGIVATSSQACPRALVASHTYTSAGTYMAKLTTSTAGGCSPEATAQGCLGAPASIRVIGTVVIKVYSSSSTVPNPIACTRDAKQCSDGSYVGRTGPNCQFVCPTNSSESVACTMDAGQCPNGTWVGRTGPNCQFVCPN